MLVELLPKTVSVEGFTELVKTVTQKEVKASMFIIEEGKALRPDGFTGHFFQVCWSIISKKVVEAIEYFFTTGDMLHAFNSSIVALVPKCKNPNCMKDFRPIS